MADGEPVGRDQETGSGMPLQVKDLGRMPYARALAIQREINLAVSQGAFRPSGGQDFDTRSSASGAGKNDLPAELPGEGAGTGCLILVEHDPVITVTHRQGAWDNLLASQSRLDELGIDIQVTDRGGDITYHGPGQLVAYPILKLNPYGLNLGSYMRLLEQVVIDTVATFGITAQRDPEATGVWVRGGVQGTGIGEQGADQSPDPRPQTPLAKICAMGVRVRKNTTMHGLALNVTTDLSHFATIDPCGLGGRPVTSLQQLLDSKAPTIEETKTALIAKLQATLLAKSREPQA